MDGTTRLIEVYKYLAALKKHHGDIQGSIEETLHSIEKELDLSTREYCVLRKEAYEYIQDW